MAGLLSTKATANGFTWIVTPTYCQLNSGDLELTVKSNNAIECRTSKSAPKRQYTRETLSKRYHLQYFKLYQLISEMQDAIAIPKFQINFEKSSERNTSQIMAKTIGTSVVYNNGRIEIRDTNNVKAVLSSFISNKIIFQVVDVASAKIAHEKDDPDYDVYVQHSKCLDKVKFELKYKSKTFEILVPNDDDLKNKYKINFSLFSKMIEITKQSWQNKQIKHCIEKRPVQDVFYCNYDFAYKKLCG